MPLPAGDTIGFSEVKGMAGLNSAGPLPVRTAGRKMRGPRLTGRLEAGPATRPPPLTASHHHRHHRHHYTVVR